MKFGEAKTGLALSPAQASRLSYDGSTKAEINRMAHFFTARFRRDPLD
jgi:hypothetical protein